MICLLFSHCIIDLTAYILFSASGEGVFLMFEVENVEAIEVVRQSRRPGQRNRAIPVWGWTEPFEIVEGSLGGVPAVARAGDDGRFVFRFPPRPAGGPLKLEVRVKSSGETVAYSDILVGEVWIASGQSNMELKIEELPSKCEAVRAEAGKLPQLRMLTVPQRAQPVPMADVAADWQVAGPECVAGWSAVGYFFARKLHRELNVPVGIVSSNWGGTVAEAWTSRETLVRNPDFAARVEAYERNLNAPGMWESLSAEELSVEHCPGGELAWFRRILPPEPENRGVTDGWASPGIRRFRLADREIALLLERPRPRHQRRGLVPARNRNPGRVAGE